MKTSRKLKRFFITRILFIVWVSFVTGMFEAIGAPFAGDYFRLIVWVLRGVLAVALGVSVWRFYIGVCRDGDLLFDDEL